VLTALPSRPPEMAADALAALGCADVQAAPKPRQERRCDEFMLNMSITWNACGSAGASGRPWCRWLTGVSSQCFLAMFMGR
jgi:hypothetical protein